VQVSIGAYVYVIFKHLLTTCIILHVTSNAPFVTTYNCSKLRWSMSEIDQSL